MVACRVSICGLLALFLPCCASSTSISNGAYGASISGSDGLTSFYGPASQPSLAISGDAAWSVAISVADAGSPAATIELSPGSCTYKGTAGAASSASSTYSCPRDISLDVVYAIKPNAAFVSKEIHLTRTGASTAFRILNVTLFDGVKVATSSSAAAAATTPASSWSVRSNPYFGGGSIAGFGRFPSASGAGGFFVSVTNPFFSLAGSTATTLTAAYAAGIDHDSSWGGDDAAHVTEAAVLGPTSLSKYDVADGFNQGERAALVACVESYLLDSASRAAKTVKVNVAWDESDYQIDVGTEAGRTEYKRIIDRNAAFGSTHIVYEPRNTLYASRFNSADGWGWEGRSFGRSSPCNPIPGVAVLVLAFVCSICEQAL